MAWRGDDQHKVSAIVPYANRLKHTSSGTQVMREAPDLEAAQPRGVHSNSARPPPRPINDDIAEELHSESCITHADVGQYGQPARASTEPPYASPLGSSQNGKKSTGTSDTLFSPSDSSQETKTEETSEPRKRSRRKFPFLHKSTEKAEDTEQDATLSRRASRRRLDKKIPIKHQLRSIFWSWPNVLLICVPIGIALNYAKVNPLAVFLVNFLAIVPLAGTLSFATEEIAMRVGETLGGLLNASFGNATELIVAIIALKEGQVSSVESLY